MEQQDQMRKFSDAVNEYRRVGDNTQEAVVSLLRETQRVFGFVPGWAQAEIADALQIKQTFLQAILKRFPSLRGEEGGIELVICTGPNCGKKGSRDLLQYVQAIQKDHQKLGEMIRLRTVSCFRQCRTAPNCRINGVLYGGMTVGLLQKQLKGLVE